MLQNTSLNRRAYLYDSIGFCRALGECPYKNEYVTQFLYEIINDGRNSESWWRAAFALEILKNKRTLWGMSLGITWDNKESLEKVLKEEVFNNERN